MKHRSQFTDNRLTSGLLVAVSSFNVQYDTLVENIQLVPNIQTKTQYSETR